MKKFKNLICPPGYPLEKDIIFLAAGLLLASLASLGFVHRYETTTAQLIGYLEADIHNIVKYPDFSYFLGHSMDGFAVLLAFMPILGALHYRFFYREAKSIYLMRRLPNRALLHRQCWTFPLIGAGAVLLFVGMLLLVYYLVYRYLTPDCLLRTVGL